MEQFRQSLKSFTPNSRAPKVIEILICRHFRTRCISPWKWFWNMRSKNGGVDSVKLSDGVGVVLLFSGWQRLIGISPNRKAVLWKRTMQIRAVTDCSSWGEIKMILRERRGVLLCCPWDSSSIIISIINLAAVTGACDQRDNEEDGHESEGCE